MIVECLLFLASVAPPEGGMDKEWLQDYRSCNKIILAQDHIDLLIEHFEEDNLDEAYKIMWCESRGEEDALRTAEGNFDSGLFQFIEPTWNWVAQAHNLPRWDDWVILYHGQPYTGPVSKSDYGFEQVKVQFSPYYNILFASLLAEDMYSDVRWKDWNSSKWCWGSNKKFYDYVRKDYVWWQNSNK